MTKATASSEDQPNEKQAERRTRSRVRGGNDGGGWLGGPERRSSRSESTAAAREMCQIGNVHQPDEPAHKEPVGPLGNLEVTVTSASSTIGAINSTLN